MNNKFYLKLYAAALILYSLMFCVPEIIAGDKNEQRKLWQKSAESSIARSGERNLFPEKYATFRLDVGILKGFLVQMPAEFSVEAKNKSVIIEIPMPDGSFLDFKIEETKILASHLAGDFPTWKTFRGVSLDNSGAVGQFDWTSKGFHGYINTARGTVLIDPFQENDTQNYLVYYKHEFGKSGGGDFACKFDKNLSESLGLENLKSGILSFVPAFSNGTNIRTYRLAVATTGEWSRGTTASTDPITVRTAALAALTTSVNRLDGIFRRELAVSLQLVNPSINNEATNIIFDDPATDPYDNTDNTAQLDINQTTINNRVGTPNYDVGHLYGTGGGGVAQTPSVCDNTSKAQGYSARAGFYGDPFTVDYAAHEIGHQFGADHTYNNADPGGACTTRSAQNAYEVASGATIMSYVGICNNRNLQQYVDTGFPSFHIRSLTQMIANIQNGEGNTCGTAGANNNNVPTVNAGNSFTIPALTPFTLTATGSDADAGDAANLLYSWEQYDLAPSASGQIGAPANTYDVDSDGILRPLFRPYSPVSSSSRTFPSLAFILNPASNDPAGSNNPPLTYTGTHPTGFPGAVCETGVTCVVGERLPVVSRTMNFRVSLRDRRGGMADAGTTVTVAGAAGPFRVTTQDSAPVSWQAGATQTINWDVAGTNANGINTANVKISLSTDGGQNFPVTLAASTPNDGSTQITVPNNATTQARIKIEAVGNIFFDINNVNFTINASNVPNRRQFDFDGDGKADVSVFRPSAGSWYLLRSTAGFTGVQFGISTDKIAPADFDGDGKTDIAVFRDGNWYLLRSQQGFTGVQFGTTGDIPQPADFDGDGRAELAVYRPSAGAWFTLNLVNNQFTGTQFGITTDKPVVGDYDGDGRADPAVYRPTDGAWYLLRSTAGFTGIQFGIATDTPVPADYDGDGKTDPAVYRNGEWYLLQSMAGFAGFQFGIATDLPAPADYDGDGKSDAAVFRDGNWYLLQSAAGFTGVSFGVPADKPVPNAFVP